MNDDSSSWEYKPDGQTVSQPPELSSSGTKGQLGTKSAKDTTITWTASEYIDHSRGPAWYLALIAGTILLAVLHSFRSLPHMYTSSRQDCKSNLRRSSVLRFYRRFYFDCHQDSIQFQSRFWEANTGVKKAIQWKVAMR